MSYKARVMRRPESSLVIVFSFLQTIYTLNLFSWEKYLKARRIYREFYEYP